jgi:hypothetical protein
MNGKAENKGMAPVRESFTELLGQLASSSATKVHDEIALLIQGFREKARAARGAVITIAIGAAIGWCACMSLCAAMIIGLSDYMAPVIAALVVGSALALVGVVIGFIGYRLLKKTIHKT